MPTTTEFKPLIKTLFKNVVAVNSQGIDCSLNDANECARHQLEIYAVPDPSILTVAIRGVLWQSKLGPAKFDSRLDAIDMSTGAKIFVFYGFFDELRFDFSAVTGSPKVSAAIVSHFGELLISGNTP